MDDEWLTRELDDQGRTRDALAELERMREMLPYLCQTNPLGITVAFILWVVIPPLSWVLRKWLEVSEDIVKRHKQGKS